MHHRAVRSAAGFHSVASTGESLFQALLRSSGQASALSTQPAHEEQQRQAQQQQQLQQQRETRVAEALGQWQQCAAACNGLLKCKGASTQDASAILELQMQQTHVPAKLVYVLEARWDVQSQRVC